MKKGVFALVWFVAVFAVTDIMAEEAGVQLKEVVVTATKTEKSPQDVTQTVTVITAEDIEKSGATTAAEVIERTTGVAVTDYGSMGALATIGIRGSSYQQVLVLLDGRRLNSASAGGFDMSNLPVFLEEIERIEIVRGPSSALYGADAVGGVVNIITKKPAGPSTTVSGAAGTHGYESLALSTSNKLDRLYYTLSAGKERSGGFRPNSDMEQGTAGMKLGYEFGPDSSLEFAADYLGKRIGVPGSLDFPSPLARERDRDFGSSLTYKTKLSKELDLRATAYETKDTIIYKNPDPVFPSNSKHTSTSKGGEVQSNWLVNSWNQLTIGVEAKQDHLKSTDAGEHTASLWGAYLQDELSLGEPLIVVIGGRNDSHSVYGDKFSPKASARYLISDTGTIIRASAGNAFRAPTLNDLYWPFDGFQVGNRFLKPETSTEYEAGIEQSIGKRNSVKVTYFDRRVDNLIQWMPGPAPTFLYSPVNIGKARITGTESEVKFVPFEWLTWAVNYTYMHSVDEITGSYVYGVPAEQLKSYINLTLPTKTSIYVEGRYVRNYFQPTIPNPSLHYTVVDAKILQPVTLGSGVKGDVFVGVKNMFDHQYQVVAGYPMPPDEVYGGLSIQL